MAWWNQKPLHNLAETFKQIINDPSMQRKFIHCPTFSELYTQPAASILSLSIHTYQFQLVLIYYPADQIKMMYIQTVWASHLPIHTAPILIGFPHWWMGLVGQP
ncbi:hypothetical protein AVEN_224836-1 [Araneus ventricosus]|uniref:Uncharacterized protein n=1 Tax=Araneus ventricosus TaxID=182803 RepID=A0A4Y2N6H6_ARAVE|nr:hypothetical protein AVEN_224836-1 [Araneus ventricosus]